MNSLPHMRPFPFLLWSYLAQHAQHRAAEPVSKEYMFDDVDHQPSSLRHLVPSTWHQAIFQPRLYIISTPVASHDYDATHQNRRQGSLP